MAMLAEPRRKQRIGPNPRGKFYGEQDSNLGKSLLHKMGWKSGEGLGLERQGIREAIKPKIQMSSKGLGFDPKENPWMEHNQEFEEILKGLNEAATVSTLSSTDVKIKSEASDDGTAKLEKKSKKSRARIHYHKFVKGKDLSGASSNDLKSIFGATTTKEEVISDDVPVSEPATAAVIVKDELTINKGSMVDYFKEKMKRKGLNPDIVQIKKEDENESRGINRGPMLVTFKQELEQEESATEFKSEVKDEDDELNETKPEVKEESKEINRGSMVDYFNQKMEQKRLKAQTLSKVKEGEETVSEEADSVGGTVKLEKKRYKKVKKLKTEIDNVDVEANCDSAISDVKEEKIKKRKVEAYDEEPSADAEMEISSKKRKRSSKKKLKCEISDDQTDETLNPVKVEHSTETIDPYSGPAITADDEPVEISLEEKLKMQMVNLKNGRQRLKKQYFSSLDSVSKKFKGANIDKVKGYTLY